MLVRLHVFWKFPPCQAARGREGHADPALGWGRPRFRSLCSLAGPGAAGPSRLGREGSAPAGSLPVVGGGAESW